MLIRRLIGSLVLIWLVLTLTFALVRAAPGDPASLLIPASASASDAARLRAELGLDKPLAVQYARSGERRVGEEGRCRGAPDHLKKKKIRIGRAIKPGRKEQVGHCISLPRKERSSPNEIYNRIKQHVPMGGRCS